MILCYIKILTGRAKNALKKSMNVASSSNRGSCRNMNKKTVKTLYKKWNGNMQRDMAYLLGVSTKSLVTEKRTKNHFGVNGCVSKGQCKNLESRNPRSFGLLWQQ